MGLLSNTDNSGTKFESMEETNSGAVQTDTAATSGTTVGTATADKPNVQAQPEIKVASNAPNTTTALAAKTATPLAVAAPKRREVKAALEFLRDAVPVDYNTLTQIIANNGNLLEREGKAPLGDTITGELFSFQASWVVDPGDDSADNDVVKYSNDGILTTEGVPVQEALSDMQNRGYPKARLKERCVLVMGIASAAKTEAFNGRMVQLDLSPKSKQQWDRYRAEHLYGIKLGKIKEEDLVHVKITAELADGPDKKTYTVAKFHFNQAAVPAADTTAAQ